MNAARWFQRREDYQPPQTPDASPFRQFDVKCLKCSSYRLRLISEFDEQSGGLSLVLFCTRCRNREVLSIR